MTGERFGIVLLSALVACVVIVTAILVKRELFPTKQHAEMPLLFAAPGAHLLGNEGRVIGSRGAPISIVVFSDYQCPSCRYFDAVLDSLLKQRENDVRVVIRDYPLTSIHPHAYAAALAARCVHSERAFAAFHRVLFASQDSLGTIPMLDLASRTKEIDTARFGSCLSSQESTPLVERDMQVGDSAAVVATPTVFLGDQRFSRLPSYRELNEAVSAALLSKR